MSTAGHAFAGRWNHNSHHYPRLAAAIADDAGRVLDIGCGDGTFCRFLAAPGRLVVGLDRDDRHLSRTDGVVYVAGSAEALGFADGSFDSVTMIAVLHHVDTRRALAEAARVLAPGGQLQVLGIARYGGPRDLPHEVRDVVAHRWHARGREEWDPPTAKAAPLETWGQARAAARRHLPGCTWVRLPLWRYRVTWTKPA